MSQQQRLSCQQMPSDPHTCEVITLHFLQAHDVWPVREQLLQQVAFAVVPGSGPCGAGVVVVTLHTYIQPASL